MRQSFHSGVILHLDCHKVRPRVFHLQLAHSGFLAFQSHVLTQSRFYRDGALLIVFFPGNEVLRVDSVLDSLTLRRAPLLELINFLYAKQAKSKRQKTRNEKIPPTIRYEVIVFGLQRVGEIIGGRWLLYDIAVNKRQ